MEKIKNAPTPLKRKLFFTCIIGILCLLIGIAMFLLLTDRIMLFLSLAVCILSFGKAAGYHRIISGREIRNCGRNLCGRSAKAFTKIP